MDDAADDDDRDTVTRMPIILRNLAPDTGPCALLMLMWMWMLMLMWLVWGVPFIQVRDASRDAAREDARTRARLAHDVA